MIQTKEQAQESLLKGVNILADIVKTTLGPKGSTVILHTPEGKAYTTKDGVSVARQVFDNDMMVDAAIQLVREATAKTADVAGDGTTTATVIAQSLINQCMTAIKNKVPVISLKRGLETAKMDVVKVLQELYSTKVGFDKKSLSDIATISANNDRSIGDIVADAFIQTGEDGLVLFDLSSNEETYIESISGMRLDSQLLSPAFINNQKLQTAEFEATDHNVAVLLIDNMVKSIQEMATPTLNKAISQQIPILLVAHEFSYGALKDIIHNNTRNNTQILPIKADGFGVGKTECLKDIAALTGAEIFDSTSTTRYEGLGACSKVIVSKFNTTIVKADSVNTEAMEKRIADLKSRIGEEKEAFNKKELTKKLAKLIGKMSIIHVGGTTESIAKEKYDRVEDAVCATKAAIEEGISLGGGVTYYNIARYLMEGKDTSIPDLVGYTILLTAIKQPMEQLALNSGIENFIPPVFAPGWGINFLTGEECNLRECGIIDPTKVLRVALENAVEITELIISTSGIVNDE
jgi:chaperonin GroEL